MALTEELITSMGLSAAGITPSDSLYFTGALEWLNDNTDFDIDTEDPEESVTALPANAKIFITRFVGILKGGAGAFSGSAVSSESIGGMSKSFGSSAESERALWLMARELLGKHLLRGAVRSVGEYSKWA